MVKTIWEIVEFVSEIIWNMSDLIFPKSDINFDTSEAGIFKKLSTQNQKLIMKIEQQLSAAIIAAIKELYDFDASKS